MAIFQTVTGYDGNGIIDAASGNRIIVAGGAVVNDEDTFLFDDTIKFSAGGSTVQVFGSVFSLFLSAIEMGSSLGTGGNNTVTVGAGGVVSGNSNTIELYGGVNRLTNSGEVIANNLAVYMQGFDCEVNNSGLIAGSGGVLFSGNNSNLLNSGTITGLFSAITVNSSSFSTVTNTGLISVSDAGAAAFQSDSGADTFLNSGRVVGGMKFGVGNDVLDNEGGDVTGRIIFGAGFDEMIGGSARERAMGGTGEDTLDFGGGNDFFVAGNDESVASDGDDDLDGGDGIDTYDARDLLNPITVRLNEQRAIGADIGQDIVIGFENVLGGFGADTLVGDGGRNLLRGNGGNDILNGLEGADKLNGFIGTDTLIGGTGRDVMTGGIQNDVFDFNSIADSGVGDSVRDLITDFGPGTDDIDLVTIDANTTLGGDQAFAFIGTGAFTNVAGQLRYSVSAATSYTTVEGDVNGDGKADFQIGLLGNLTLAAGDFAL